MKTLIRSIVTAALFAVVGGTGSTAAAQHVSVDVRIGTPGYHFRHYRHGHHYHRQYHRPYAGHYRRSLVVIRSRPHYYRRPIVGHRPLRAHRSPRYGYH